MTELPMARTTTARGGDGRGLPAALPTGRAGRLLALGLLVLLLAVAWEAVAMPVIELYRARTERLEDGRDRLARMEALAARLPALRREAAGGQAQNGPAALIDGATDAIASAALQGQVQQMASSLGATLSSSETVSGKAGGDAGPERGGKPRADGFRRIGVRISVTAPFAVMVKLLGRIAQSSPVLLVDDLQLHGSRIQLGSNPPLEASMTVLAFRRADAHRTGSPGTDPEAAAGGGADAPIGGGNGDDGSGP
ncbi:MAG: general secretion pathway protein GspM [Gluconacetobacter diazotrophicus]|nr:general secretion pathway protein GspM [Gluconacetobacter diazotrophicus]